MAPVRFEPGAIGNRRRLMLSPQHRVLISDWKAELFFGEPEVLTAAVHLVNGTTIIRVQMAEVAYFHIMFDAHQVIFAEGAPCESLFASDHTLDAIGTPARDHLRGVVGEQEVFYQNFGDTARLSLREFEAQLLH